MTGLVAHAQQLTTAQAQAGTPVSAQAQAGTSMPDGAQAPQPMSAEAQAPQAVSAEAFAQLPSYVIVLEESDGEGVTEISELPDSLFNAISQGVIYKVNSTVLDTTSPVLADIVARLEALNHREGDIDHPTLPPMSLVGIEYRAAASPEGPWDNNVRLARGRAESFERFIGQYVDMSQLRFVKKRVTTEDYEYLAWLMETAGDADASFVRAQIDHYTMSQPLRIKAALRERDNGALWRRILRQYYPQVRATRVVMYFERGELPPIPTVEPQVELLTPHVPMLAEVPTVPAMPRHPYERPHLLAVSSNLLYDACVYLPDFGWAPSPNIGVEFFPVPEGKWTIKAQFLSPYWHKWDKHKFFQIRDYHLELRRYFDPGKLHTGWYLAAFAHATKYGIGFGPRRGWEGEGAGGSLKLGYMLPIGTGRFRLDLHVAAGLWITRYDPYVFSNPITGEVVNDHDKDYFYDWTGRPEDFHRRNHRLTWLGPTEVGVTLSFDLLYRKGPRSASLHRYFWP